MSACRSLNQVKKFQGLDGEGKMPIPMALRTTESEREATWLELFYDLIYVVVIARLVHTLAHHAEAHLTVGALLEFMVLFIPVSWALIGHSICVLIK